MAPSRQPSPRRYLMCSPTHFEVTYAINPWMDPSKPVDTDLAMRQWTSLHDAYLMLGHEVDLIEPVAGLPDMVFAANGGLVVDGHAIAARFANAERAAEADHYLAWLRQNGYPHVTQARTTNEGEGDYLTTGSVILAGSGFRSVPGGHEEVEALTGREVVGLELIDPRYYHLDTALCVLDDESVAYFPEAFSAASLADLRRRFPDAIEASAHDASVLGLNAVSDGRNVVVAAQAERFIAQLEQAGYTPVPVDLSEFAKSGGGPKCCTMELRPTLAVEQRSLSA